MDMKELGEGDTQGVRVSLTNFTSGPDAQNFFLKMHFFSLVGAMIHLNLMWRSLPPTKTDTSFEGGRAAHGSRQTPVCFPLPP